MKDGLLALQLAEVSSVLFRCWRISPHSQPLCLPLSEAGGQLHREHVLIVSVLARNMKVI